MKTANLTVYKDQYKGLIPAGCTKLVDSNNLQVFGSEYIALDNIYDQPDQCEMIYRAGQKVPDNTPGSLRVTKVKINGSWSWVLEPQQEISALFQDCCLSANPAPVVSLASSSATPATGATITLTATASDDGSVAKVEFYEDNTLLGTDSGTPFTQSVVAITKGPHTYVAKAFDNLGKIKFSNIVIVNAL